MELLRNVIPYADSALPNLEKDRIDIELPMKTKSRTLNEDPIFVMP
jgi:hypothetical protein